MIDTLSNLSLKIASLVSFRHPPPIFTPADSSGTESRQDLSDAVVTGLSPLLAQRRIGHRLDLCTPAYPSE